MISDDIKSKVDAFLKHKSSPILIGILLKQLKLEFNEDELEEYLKSKVSTYKPRKLL